MKEFILILAIAFIANTYTGNISTLEEKIETKEEITIEKNYEDKISLVNEGIEKIKAGEDVEVVIENMAKDTEVKVSYINYKNKFYTHPKMELPSDYDPSARVWHKKAVEEGEYMSEPYVDAVENKEIITYAKPIYDAEQNLLGVIGIDFEK